MTGRDEAGVGRMVARPGRATETLGRNLQFPGVRVPSAVGAHTSSGPVVYPGGRTALFDDRRQKPRKHAARDPAQSLEASSVVGSLHDDEQIAWSSSQCPSLRCSVIYQTGRAAISHPHRLGFCGPLA